MGLEWVAGWRAAEGWWEGGGGGGNVHHKLYRLEIKVWCFVCFRGERAGN